MRLQQELEDFFHEKEENFHEMNLAPNTACIVILIAVCTKCCSILSKLLVHVSDSPLGSSSLMLGTHMMEVNVKEENIYGMLNHQDMGSPILYCVEQAGHLTCMVSRAE